MYEKMKQVTSVLVLNVFINMFLISFKINLFKILIYIIYIYEYSMILSICLYKNYNLLIFPPQREGKIKGTVIKPN